MSPRPPTFSGLVVLYRRHHVIVDSARHLQIRVRVSLRHDFTRPLTNRVVKRYHPIRRQPALSFRGAQHRGVVRGRSRLDVFPTHAIEPHRDRWRLARFHAHDLIAQPIGFDMIRRGRLYPQGADALIVVVMRNRNPETNGAGRNSGRHPRLILKAEMPFPRRGAKHCAQYNNCR